MMQNTPTRDRDLVERARTCDIGSLIGQALEAGRFFASPGKSIVCRHDPQQTVAWELLGGHLLDETQTRETKTFAAWDVTLASNAGPDERLLSVLWSAEDTAIHVVRHLLIQGWEAYEAEPNVILSRPARKWTRELVGTLPTEHATAGDDFAALLRQLMHRAFVGTSRLPVTSGESPLPAYALGQCGYLSGAKASGPYSLAEHFLRDALTSAGQPWEQAMALDMALRAAAPDDIPSLDDVVSGHYGKEKTEVAGLFTLFRTLFNHLALTPYARLGPNVVELLRRLSAHGPPGAPAVIDIISYWLRHLVRHVTAFDLRTFHNRGADYPDLLLLDGLLKLYAELIAQYPAGFIVDQDGQPAQRPKLRRRALRQAWFLRRHYEGLAVPATPTSPGDLTRVLPEGFPRASEQEVAEPSARSNKLFAGDPIDELVTEPVRIALARSFADLTDDFELRELGIAVYMDRPLGVAKQPGEVDRTPLLTYEAFSRSIIRQRLKELHRWGLITDAQHTQTSDHLRRLVIGGQTPPAGWPPRPGTPSLEDANLAGPDFLFLRTTRGSLTEFLKAFDLTPLRAHNPQLHDWLLDARDVLLLRQTANPAAPKTAVLTAFDGKGERLALDIAHPGARFVEECGRELPAEGLRVLSVDGRECEIRLALA
jgi:hypothetical protein